MNPDETSRGRMPPAGWLIFVGIIIQTMDIPTIPLFSKQILILEDEDPVRQMITQTLEIEGYTVFQACERGKAMELMGIANPELILAAVNPPQFDGIHFYQSIRNDPRWLAVPFIFLASQESPQASQTARALEVEDHLTKPVDQLELVRIVNARLLRAAEVQIAYMDKAYLETVNVLANTVEGRDPYTHGHVERVAAYARWLAEALHWSDSHLRTLDFGARLHDIGKITIPDHILNKPSALTPIEWSLMKQHPRAGAKILRNISHLQAIVPYVMFHHERWDGSGYPQGLRGRDIPMEGRLLSIADVYDALTTQRPYHPARPQAEVVRFLQHHAGTYFDPDLVTIFIHVITKHQQIR